MIVIFILTKFGFFSICKSHYWECVEVKHNQWTCLTNSKPRDANDKALQITSLFDLRGTTNTLTKNYPKYTPPNRSCTKTMDQSTAQLGKARVLLQSQVTWLKEGGYFNLIFFGGFSENIDPRAVEARGRDEMIHSVCQQLTRLVVSLSSMSNKPPPQSFDQNLINCSIVFSATRFQCLWQKINK